MYLLRTLRFALLLQLAVAQLWCAVDNDNIQVNITVTINVAPTIDSVLTIDSNNDGFIDQLTLNFDQLVDINDTLAGADGLSGITLSNGYQIVPADYSASSVMSVTLDLIPQGVPDTGVTPIIDYVPGNGTDISSVATTLPMDNHSLISTDGAPPVLMCAQSDVGQDSVLLQFSEPTFGSNAGSGPVEFADLAYNDLGGSVGPNAVSLGDSDASDLLFSLQLDAPLAAGDFGTDSISTFSNEFFDAGGLPAMNNTRTLELIDNTPPTIASYQTRDANADGYIDGVLVTLDEQIDDTSLVASDFLINGAGTLGIGSFIGESTNDNLVLLTFTDGILDSGQTPQASYNAGSLSDLFGNAMLDQTPASSLDRAGPAILSANTVTTTTVRIVFSEPVDDSSLDPNDFFFNGFVTSAANGYGVSIDTGSFVSDNEIIVTLPGTIGPNETGLVSFDSPGVTRDVPGNWNDQNTGVPVTDGNPDVGPPPPDPNGPRIVSEARLWALEDDRWTYDLTVDVRELVPEGHLGMTERFDLQFNLGGTVPAGMTITKTGALTARVSWPRALGNNEHVRITVQVSDLPSSTQEMQDVLIYVVDPPTASH